ncbi:hypothetical protein ACC840_36825, partial [Rhizobium ruizarguesonis]
VTVYAQLTLAEDHAGIEVNHIAFHDPSADPDENTIFLKKILREARYSVNQPPHALAGWLSSRESRFHSLWTAIRSL